MNNLQNIDAYLTSIITPIVDKSVKTALREFQLPQTKESRNKILSVQEAAVFLNLAVPTVYSMTSKHIIPYYKRGKKLYFSESELSKWIAAGKRKSNAELDQVVVEYLTKKGGSHE